MFFPALVWRSVARAGHPFVGLLALLAGFQIALVLVASSFEREGSFAQLAGFIPGFVQQTLGSTFGLIASFQGFVAFGYFHPIVVIALTQLGIYLATEPAGEVEGGLVDLLLARGLARHWIITRSLVVMAGSTAIVVAAMVAATFFGLRSLAPDEASATPASTIMTLAIHLLAVTWCFGALALAVGARGRRRGAAFAAVSVTAVFLFLLEFLAASWEPARPFRWISPFHYYQGMSILAGTAGPARDLLVLGVATAVFTAVAYWQFSRRDL